MDESDREAESPVPRWWGDGSEQGGLCFRTLGRCELKDDAG